MNSILICICTYNRNKKLINCLKSVESLLLKKKHILKVLILDNTINFSSKKIINKNKYRFNFEIIHKNEKKRGIVNARNTCLKYIRKIKPKYVSFIDDDCTLDKSWLKNSLSIFKNYNFDIITGPQEYIENFQSNKKNTNYAKFFEKKYNQEILKVNWAATNNVIFKYKIINNNDLKFDHKLNKFGMGEDQLFFSLLKKRGNIIGWSKKVKVYEDIHQHRLSFNWLKKRSYRLGVLGFYIDKKIYGNFLGIFLNYLKASVYLFMSILTVIFLFNKNFKIHTLNYINRFLGKIAGPFVFSKIDFFKK